jgi:hypothetical protein
MFCGGSLAQERMARVEGGAWGVLCHAIGGLLTWLNVNRS